MSTPLDEPCAGVAELVTDYLEDALPQHRRTSFETHVVYCPGCAPFLAQIRETIALLRRLPTDSVDVAARDALVTRLGSGA